MIFPSLPLAVLDITVGELLAGNEARTTADAGTCPTPPPRSYTIGRDLLLFARRFDAAFLRLFLTGRASMALA